MIVKLPVIQCLLLMLSLPLDWLFFICHLFIFEVFLLFPPILLCPIFFSRENWLSFEVFRLQGLDPNFCWEPIDAINSSLCFMLRLIYYYWVGAWVINLVSFLFHNNYTLTLNWIKSGHWKKDKKIKIISFICKPDFILYIFPPEWLT